MDARTEFERLRSAETVDPAEVEALWGELPTVEVADILGPWRGGDFACGHPASRLLSKLAWHGKDFTDPMAAKPLICRGADGALQSNTDAAGGGEASLWDVSFRGEVTATMVYDRMPVLDHFKSVDADTLIGVMNGKLAPYFGVPDLYWFWLERDR
ncbi:DUF4334 domain-containing protein [Nocardioides sp. GY 10113]|uniref:DUF4334 domain-containing protein n=1 Tax=Nocardioides sp. GY 10113 TaxID=2569761 RepID=UPI0010A8662B|nr:DUF4334 domain-containing protein [Nocardioides sp. GY 10113]TIC88707.1 DUF4334 domain-containing protein [Nocardioides sp. GY 10113]